MFLTEIMERMSKNDASMVNIDIKNCVQKIQNAKENLFFDKH